MTPLRQNPIRLMTPRLKLGDDGKVVCEGKSDVNAKVSTAAGETIKTDENGEKPTGGPKADNPAIATPPTDNIQTISAACRGRPRPCACTGGRPDAEA